MFDKNPKGVVSALVMPVPALIMADIVMADILRCYMRYSSGIALAIRERGLTVGSSAATHIMDGVHSHLIFNSFDVVTLQIEAKRPL
jgi:hypothetical protein